MPSLLSPDPFIHLRSIFFRLLGSISPLSLAFNTGFDDRPFVGTGSCIFTSVQQVLFDAARRNRASRSLFGGATPKPVAQPPIAFPHSRGVPTYLPNPAGIA